MVPLPSGILPAQLPKAQRLLQTLQFMGAGVVEEEALASDELPHDVRRAMTGRSAARPVRNLAIESSCASHPLSSEGPEVALATSTRRAMYSSEAAVSPGKSSI